MYLSPIRVRVKTDVRQRLVKSFDQPKTLENDLGRLIHREGGIAKNSEHFLAPPEGFVAPSPRFNRYVPFTFVHDVRPRAGGRSVASATL